MAVPACQVGAGHRGVRSPLCHRGSCWWPAATCLPAMTGLSSRPRGQGLSELGYEVVSTGGSAAAIEAAGLPVLRVEELTGFPEMLDGAPHYRASAAPDGLRVSAPGISQPLREPCLGHTWNARAAPTTAA